MDEDKWWDQLHRCNPEMKKIFENDEGIEVWIWEYPERHVNSVYVKSGRYNSDVYVSGFDHVFTSVGEL